MKIFVDSNILISSYFFGGLVSRDLEIIAKKNELYISDYVLDEFAHTLIRKFGTSKDKWERIIRLVDSVMFRHGFKILLNKSTNYGDELNNIKTRDVKDNSIVRCAIQNHMDAILTGDKDLLDLKISQIKMLSLNQYAQLLRENFFDRN